MTWYFLTDENPQHDILLLFVVFFSFFFVFRCSPVYFHSVANFAAEYITTVIVVCWALRPRPVPCHASTEFQESLYRVHVKIWRPNANTTHNGISWKVPQLCDDYYGVVGVIVHLISIRLCFAVLLEPWVAFPTPITIDNSDGCVCVRAKEP